MKGLRQRNLLQVTPYVVSKHLQLKRGLPPVLTRKMLLSVEVDVLARQKIVEALKMEPYLSTAHVARLFYSHDAAGQPAKSFKIRPRKTSNTTYELEPGYFSAYRRLRAMLKDGLVKQHKLTVPGSVDVWTLPGVSIPKNWFNREHELDCADIFVALHKTGKLESWDPLWTDVEAEEIAKEYGLYYDRRIELEGFNGVIFLEVDRGTEDVKKLHEKARKYVRLARDYPKEKILVFFTIQGYFSKNLQKRTENIIRYAIHPQKMNALFLLAPHELFLENPLGEVCISPDDWNVPVKLL